jgi:hypothetical protein
MSIDHSQNKTLQVGINKIFEVHGVVKPATPGQAVEWFNDNTKKFEKETETDPAVRILYIDKGKAYVGLSGFADHKNLEQLIPPPVGDDAKKANTYYSDNIKYSGSTRVWTVPLDKLQEAIHKSQAIEAVAGELGTTNTEANSKSFRDKISARVPDRPGFKL